MKESQQRCFERKKQNIIVLFFILIFGGIQYVNADDAQTIHFGQTAALNGPAKALGTGMHDGLMAAFQEINTQGGIQGKLLKLTAYDDGYEPDQAIENTKKLIEVDNVFALVGGVGTPTANAIEPITSKAKIPFIGPFTGAEFLRNPYKRYVVNVRGSYWQETEELVERLTADLGVSRIAIFYQDDSYGRAGLSGVKRALEKRNLELVAEGTYKRNTTAVKSAILKIRKSKPDAIVMVGAYKPCAEFIRIAKTVNLNPLFVNISFVGSEALAQELGDDGKGVIISQVVPFPFSSQDSDLVATYQKAMKAYKSDAHFDFVSLEGYLVGRVAIEVLKHIEGEITAESFLDTLYDMKDIKIDDVLLQYGEKDNQGFNKIFMTILQDDKQFKPVKTLAQ